MPSYEAATGSVAAHRGENRTAAEEKAMGGQLGDGEQFLEVTVEARYNDQELFEESSVVLRPSGNGVEVFVKVSVCELVESCTCCFGHQEDDLVLHVHCFLS